MRRPRPARVCAGPAQWKLILTAPRRFISICFSSILHPQICYLSLRVYLSPCSSLGLQLLSVSQRHQRQSSRSSFSTSTNIRSSSSTSTGSRARGGNCSDGNSSAIGTYTSNILGEMQLVSLEPFGGRQIMDFHMNCVFVVLGRAPRPRGRGARLLYRCLLACLLACLLRPCGYGCSALHAFT